MKILLITQYFWPEQFIINDLVKELAAQGHSILVLTGKPNYPDGQIFSGYKQDSSQTETYIPGVEVFRAPLRPRGLKDAKNLFLNYCSFLFNGFKYFPKAIKDQHFDVILAIGFSPITSVIPAILVKRKLKRHLAIWIQDLWPDSLKATGYISNKGLLWLVKCLVRWIYFCSDTILVQSRAFEKQIRQLVKKEKIIYYANSFAQHLIADTSDQFLTALLSKLENHFCIIFAGNLGTAQSLDTLLDAAIACKQIENFRLIIVGSGSMNLHLKQRIEDESIENVILAGRYPVEVMPVIFDRADGLVVSLKKNELFSYTIPSKVQAYLAAGRPIIASLNGEGAAIIEEACAGLTCPAEDSLALSHCIERLYSMPESERDAMGRAGREYFLQHFEMSSQARKLIDILNQRIAINAT